MTDLPLTLIAELSYKCPLHCPYCSNPLEIGSDHYRSELSTEEWARVLREARSLGALQLGLTGGEPLVRKDLEQIVAVSRELGLYSTLVTSAIPLTLGWLYAVETAVVLLPGSAAFYLPLVRDDKAVGVLGIAVPEEGALTLGQRDLLEAFARQLALIVEREHLRESSAREKLLAESDKLHRVLLDSERGYNTTLPQPGIALSREVIFAERKFVATPLDIGIRIGGAAEFAGLKAAPNYKRSDALLTLGKRFLPGIRDEGAVQWMGHRPATPDSLPVIGKSPTTANVIYAFGHGHLGLTQCATTGALVADLLVNRTPRTSLEEYSIKRFRK